MATYELSYRASDAVNGTTLAVSAQAVSGSAERPPTTMPASIPSDQAYYWSIAWQNDVREALEALRRGEYEDFESDDPNDVARWLLSSED